MMTFYIDEAGRGPLAGPVSVGCVYRTTPELLAQCHDSKQLSARRRGEIMQQIRGSNERIRASGKASADMIDRHGIVQAIRYAINQAITKICKQIHLQKKSHLIQIVLDGNTDYGLRKQGYNVTTIIKGDQTIKEISAASIIAKVERDAYMDRLALRESYQIYHFEKHKGYGTLAHRNAIKQHGLSKEHRASFCRNIVSGRDE